MLLGIPPISLNALLAGSRGRIPVPPGTITVGIPADLLRRRPDVRAAELAALAQNAQIGVAEAQLYPAISITGTFGGAASTANGHNLGDVFTSKGLTYAAGPSFQWNILNYGQITNNVRFQDAKLQQVLQETKLEWETKRNADFARVGKELKYLESTQNVVWKETLLNNSNLEMLARNYVKAAPRESQQ